MKKLIKITALLLMLTLTMSMVCGCATTGEDEEEEIVYAEMTIGLPYDEDSANWNDLMNMVKNEDDGFEFWNNAIVTLVTVPEAGTEEYTKFINKVYDGKIDMFLAPSTDDLDRLIEDGKLVNYTSINKTDSRFTESLIPSAKAVAREDDRLTYSIPFTGSYQGLFYNTAVFERAGVAVPTDWTSLNTAITELKAKGITPFAAGFADGAGYWLDEMILAEGGVAEHSAIPSKGVINSWSRAVNKIKNLYNAGAFSADAISNTHDVAVAEFCNESAAMILCSSSDIAGKVSTENVEFMPFPKTDTGIKEDNAIIAKSEWNIYINAKSFKKAVDDSTNMSGVMAEFVVSYIASADYYSTVFAYEGTFPFNKEGADCMDTSAEEAAWAVLEETEYADMPMETYLLTFDQLASGLIDVLNGSVSVDEYLLNATDAELAAQADKKAAQAGK